RIPVGSGGRVFCARRGSSPIQCDRKPVGKATEVVIMRRPRHFRQVAVPIAALALFTAVGPAATVQAQHTPDPFHIRGEGNLGYQDYMYSTYPNGIGFTPNQGILQSRSGNRQANQFTNYIEQLDGAGTSLDRLSDFGMRGRGGIEPYFRAH